MAGERVRERYNWLIWLRCEPMFETLRGPPSLSRRCCDKSDWKSNMAKPQLAVQAE